VRCAEVLVVLKQAIEIGLAGRSGWRINCLLAERGRGGWDAGSSRRPRVRRRALGVLSLPLFGGSCRIDFIAGRLGGLL
jgi:hypothetical protein